MSLFSEAKSDFVCGVRASFKGLIFFFNLQLIVERPVSLPWWHVKHEAGSEPAEMGSAFFRQSLQN